MIIPKQFIKLFLSKFGTPLFIYNADLISSRLQIFKKFKTISPYFSIKANPNLTICSIFKENGFGAEVSSDFERRLVLETGFVPTNIMFDGPAKTKNDIDNALRSGILHFNIESIDELERIINSSCSKLNIGSLNICLRINPSSKFSSPELMTGVSSQFGIDEEELPSIINKIKQRRLTISGIHLYIGSQFNSSQHIENNFQYGLDLLEQMYISDKTFFSNKINYVFGPGIGYDYSSSKDVVDISSLLNNFSNKMKSSIFEENSIILKFELGRILLAPCAIYLTQVVETKQSRNKFFVKVDGGINHFMRYLITKTSHKISLLDSVDRPIIDAIITGPTCTPYDIISQRELPKPKAGDILIVHDTGAYGWSMGLANFSSRPTPPEVLYSKSFYKIIRRGESYTDFISKMQCSSKF